MKKFLLLCTIFASCYEKSGKHEANAVITNHDIRVAAKRFIRKDLKEPAKAQFAPDNEIKIVRMKPDNTFMISIYEEEQNGKTGFAKGMTDGRKK